MMERSRAIQYFAQRATNNSNSSVVLLCLFVLRLPDNRLSRVTNYSFEKHSQHLSVVCRGGTIGNQRTFQSDKEMHRHQRKTIAS
jgi:hypothetical protein